MGKRLRLGCRVFFVVMLVGLAVTSMLLGTFYLPGLPPVNYCLKQTDQNNTNHMNCQARIPVYVSSLSSTRTLLPFSPFFFDLCEADKIIESDQNFDEILYGNHWSKGPLELEFGKQEINCKLLCRKTYTSGDPVSQAKLEKLHRAIRDQYHYNWMVDNLPAAWCYHFTDDDEGKNFCLPSIPLGCYMDKKGGGRQTYCDPMMTENTYYLFNHFDISVYFHWDETFKYSRITSVVVSPKSIADPEGLDICTSTEFHKLPSLSAEKNHTIAYTYTVEFHEEGNVLWGERWLSLLQFSHPSITYMSLFNSAIIVVFLWGLVGVMYWRNVRRDVRNYLSDEGCSAKSGWISVRSDIFRPPKGATCLLVLIGTGRYLIYVVLLTLVFACLGMLSPANRGALAICVLFFSMLLSFIRGQQAARLHKYFGGSKKEWAVETLATALFFPSVALGFGYAIDVVYVASGSTSAMSMKTAGILLIIWLVAVLVSIIGSLVGFRRKVMVMPAAVSEKMRRVPTQKFLLWKLPIAIIGGIMPFGVLFIAEYFVLNNIFYGQYLYIPGFLMAVFLMLLMTCAPVTILTTQWLLDRQNHRWWWSSFLCTASTGVYVFVYSIIFYATKSEIVGFPGICIYLAVTLFGSICIGLISGSMGVTSTLIFLTKQYKYLRLQENK